MKFQILLFLSVYTTLFISNVNADTDATSIGGIGDGDGHVGCTGSLELTPPLPRGRIE